MDKIKCIYCGKEFEVTEALREHIKSQELDKLNDEHRAEVEKYKARVQEAEKNELEIRKQKEALEEEKRKFELEKQRQLDIEREKIRIKAQEEQSEKDKLKFAEYEKRLSDMTKSLEEANRKAVQGSQQLQGEVKELDLEEVLKKLFPSDGITEVKKGELGADVRQMVRSPRGSDCGKILWESKRTKTWSDGWIDKLKEDLIRDKARFGVMVSEVLPEDIKKGIGMRNGIWIINAGLIEPVAAFLRKNLLDVARERFIATNKQSKSEDLYKFVTSNEFVQQVERMVQAYLEMKDQVNRERASSERQWKQREMQIDRLLTGVSGIYGSIQEIAGPALPQIKLLESENISEG